MVDLASIVLAAVAEHAVLLNSTGKRWPDRPIRVSMSWHPRMQKLDVVVETVDRLPSWHPPKVA